MTQRDKSLNIALLQIDDYLHQIKISKVFLESAREYLCTLADGFKSDEENDNFSKTFLLLDAFEDAFNFNIEEMKSIVKSARNR